MAVCVLSGERQINELLMDSDPLTHPPFKLMRSLQLVFGIITLATGAYVVSVSSYWYVVHAYGRALLSFHAGAAHFIFADFSGIKGLPVWRSS